MAQIEKIDVVASEAERAVLSAVMFEADGSMRDSWVEAPDQRAFNAGFHTGNVMAGGEMTPDPVIDQSVSVGFEQAAQKIEAYSELSRDIRVTLGWRAIDALGSGGLSAASLVVGAFLVAYVRAAESAVIEPRQLGAVQLAMGGFMAYRGVKDFRKTSRKLDKLKQEKAELTEGIRSITGFRVDGNGADSL